MTEPRDHYVGEGGDGSDKELPDAVPDPAPRPPAPDANPDEGIDLDDIPDEEE